MGSEMCIRDSLSTVVDALPAHGTVSLNADGSFTYTPAANYNGPDSFTYHATDGAADSNIATVAVTVTAVDDAPLVQNDTYMTNGSLPLVVTAANGLLANDSDVESSALTVTLAQPPSQGTVDLHPDGSFTYQAREGFVGRDSFSYSVSDGNASRTGTVFIDVVAPPPGELPATGARSTGTAWLALAAIVAGMLLTAPRRRRPSSARRPGG